MVFLDMKFRKLAQTGHQKEELDKQRKILQKRKPPSEKILGKQILLISNIFP